MVDVNLGFDKAKLGSLINRVKENPETGKTVWTATTRWDKGFRSEATIRSHTVAMDEPMQLGGSDTAPNMVEVVLGAYGCCLTTGFVANAGMLGIELEGVDINLAGDLDLQAFFGLKPPEEVAPGYTEVRAEISLNAPTATEDQLKQLYDSVVATSPVGSIIARPVKVVTELKS
ncbi:OsmC family protein [Pseudonocardia hispaniensis]|uniref:OsmC family protein n=1 Tax=Pseudonocardia hispaniensis TaxID=904933 RepID=A0ABW1J3Y5_9PSEU